MASEKYQPWKHVLGNIRINPETQYESSTYEIGHADICMAYFISNLRDGVQV
jgi:hypothetical protein